MASSVINVVINAKTVGAVNVDSPQASLTNVQVAADRAAKGLAKIDTHKLLMSCGALSASLSGLVSSLDFATEGYKSFDAAMRAANTMASKMATIQATISISINFIIIFDIKNYLSLIDYWIKFINFVF